MTYLNKYPPQSKWKDWTELDAKAWPDKVERNYTLVPTTCFNCEAACGLLAYFDNETGDIAKIEGNPEHPASRGRNCAKGPGHAQPDLRPGARAVPAQADGRARFGPVGTDHLGPGAERDRRAHPHGFHGGPPQRGDVPRRSPRRGRLRRSRAEGVGDRRPQQPHQHLLVERAHRLPVVDGPRPPVERFRERRGDLPHLEPSRGRALLQPARAADHGSAREGRDGDLRRPTVE